MPTSPAQAKSSTSHSNGGKCPMTGSRASGRKSWRKALTRVENRMMNASAVTQWAAATTGSRLIRVWPRNSRARVHVRAAGSSLRVESG